MFHAGPFVFGRSDLLSLLVRIAPKSDDECAKIRTDGIFTVLLFDTYIII